MNFAPGRDKKEKLKPVHLVRNPGARTQYLFLLQLVPPPPPTPSPVPPRATECILILINAFL